MEDLSGTPTAPSTVRNKSARKMDGQSDTERSKSRTRISSTAPVVVETIHTDTSGTVAVPAVYAAPATKTRAKRTPKPEPLLTPNPRRFVLFPIEHKDVYDLYKKHQASIWRSEEMKLEDDLKDWEKLSEGEQHFVKHVLAFFASSDGIVMENLAERFASEVQWTEARQFYAVQMYMESVHNETYSLLIDTYIKDPAEKERMFNAIQTVPCIKKKAEWAMQWIENKEADFAQRLMCFAIVEQIQFAGSFCCVFWFKERGLLPGLTASNEWISRDEGMHVDMACLLYSKIVNRVPKSTAAKIIKEAVKIEKEFICEALPCRLIGMNADHMCQYIEFVADRLAQQLGYAKIYNTVNPFEFMNRISIDTKTNFFEKRVTNYAAGDIIVGAVPTGDAKPKVTSKADF